MKSLRRILNVPPTFIDRTQTNQVVREQVEQYGVDATNFSQVWKNQKLKLFGHILRANHKDPLRQVLFSYNSFAPRNIPLKRRGRPKLDWLQETIKDALFTPWEGWLHLLLHTKMFCNWWMLPPFGADLFDLSISYGRLISTRPSANSLRAYRVNTKKINTLPCSIFDF